jgi:aspartyl-tRNA(Asn)/glutamyl-tRNA(Gln) amidotransferase subunit A
MPHERTIIELREGLQKNEFTAEELTHHYLERIEGSGRDLNAFITVTADLALDQARQSDIDRRKGVAGPLSGIPIAYKDLFCTRGVRTSAGSLILDNFTAPYSATVVEKLSNAGAVMMGKTNMDEFAMGSSNENSHYGNVLNPWDRERVPGGSSGGSAAAVAAGLCAATTGTDTGGSIRQPASFCGVTGIKPTYGRISRWGIIAFASSLDQAGPITRTAADAALMLGVMAGHDAKDSTSINAPVPDYTGTLGDSIKGLRIGLCREYFEEGLDDTTGKIITEAVSVLKSLGAVISEVSLPSTRHAVPAYYVIAPAECSANLSRYDGVRFGYRCENPADLDDLYKRSRSEGFGSEVKQRILVGAFALSAGYYDAYYRKAQQVRRLIRNDFLEAFKEVDVLLGPTSPAPAFRIGEKSDDQIAMYLQDIYTISANLAGLPAISIPAGMNGHLPTGLQLIGNYLDEGRLLNVAHQFQQQTDWHQLSPPEGSG